MRHRKALIAGALLVVVVAAATFTFDLIGLSSFGAVKARLGDLTRLTLDSPALVGACFFGLYVAGLAFCVPGAVLTLSLLAGALFGHVHGVALVAAATAVGSTAPFLLARHVARDRVRERLGPRFAARPHDETADALFLLSLRLVAVVPHFVVNLGMGLTRIRLWRFVAVTLVGTFPSTLVYVHAGTQMARIDSLSDVLSPAILSAFVLLAALPIAARLIAAKLHPRPARHDVKTAPAGIAPEPSSPVGTGD